VIFTSTDRFDFLCLLSQQNYLYSCGWIFVECFYRCAPSVKKNPSHFGGDTEPYFLSLSSGLNNTAVRHGSTLGQGELPPKPRLCPQMWYETLFNELKTSAYSYKKQRSVAFKIRHNAFSAKIPPRTPMPVMPWHGAPGSGAPVGGTNFLIFKSQ